MPNWKMIIPIISIMNLAGCTEPAQSKEKDKIEILDGSKLVDEKLKGGLYVDFDGNNELKIRSKYRTLILDAKSPSVISSSEDGEYIVFNYGNGSGQFYMISVYNMKNGKEVDLENFFAGIRKFSSETPRCSISLEEISVLFYKWHGSRDISVRSEDLSRREGCLKINRFWEIDLEKTKFL